MRCFPRLRGVQSLTPHVGEVSAMVYCAEDRVVVSCGWDHAIRVHDEVPSWARITCADSLWPLGVVAPSQLALLCGLFAPYFLVTLLGSGYAFVWHVSSVHVFWCWGVLWCVE